MRAAAAGCSSSSRTVSRSASGLNFNDPRYLITRSQPSLATNHCLVEINEEEEEGGFKTAKGKQIGRDIEETSNALTDAIGKVLHRGENLQHLRSTTNRLGNVTGMFNRHGRAAETQAWIERVKTTAISEILFYGVLALASAMGVILLFVFLEWILWGSDASPTPGTPGTPPVVPPPAPAPAPAPAPGAPGTCPGTYFTALPVWLVQLIELFTFYMLASTMLKRGLAWWDKNYGGTSFDRNREDDDDEEY
ncbi:hypothetical protein BCR33DRAFT_2539 [Rhizoclosmatium globosum]|uniref:V-SNARE coiled-coil homology domain-containing protein n=1 Tax=Rhizoclosmatium globosum TaxID=329046 RepID=A0A1Y2D351_9FUNG|nr:hypothetical protein BCR33DRAFT_2539 [Rhizoclosmatium globosum]|eukprot:ORY53546.1 hypothetical protein BCR33DRAFT_2539 [Rhizoclosmatium globosum]